MTTENVSTELPDDGNLHTERSLDDLLELHTYQDMTDDEIEKVLEYRIHKALTSAEFAARLEEGNIKTEEMVNYYREKAEQSKAIMEHMHNVRVNLVNGVYEVVGASEINASDFITQPESL